MYRMNAVRIDIAIPMDGVLTPSIMNLRRPHVPASPTTVNIHDQIRSATIGEMKPKKPPHKVKNSDIPTKENETRPVKTRRFMSFSSIYRKRLAPTL